MFRIKTDIRQYKCETKDKVEKLIRNWVIRPSDLIYNRDAKEWLPIGEHPSFVGLFGMLAEQEKNTPDTVVTARSPYADGVPPDDDDIAAGPGNVISEATDDARKEEVTHIVSRPAFDEKSEASEAVEDVAEEEDSAEDAAEEPAEPLETDEQRETDEVAATDRDEVSGDARETDVFEQDEIAETMGSNPVPPEAPDGVEPPSSNDEVTMMTEKTLEMLKVTDEDHAADDEADAADSEASDDAEGEPEEAPADEDEETTNIVESPLDSEGEEDSDADADNESDDGDEEEADAEEDDDDVEETEDDAEATKQPRLGRHDLPEELFATNEISSPEVQEKMKTIDDLGELSGASDAEDDEESSNDGKTPRWGSKLQEDSGVDEAWAVIEDEVPSSISGEDAALRTTDELDREDEEEDEDWDEVEWEEEWEGDTPEPELIQVRDFVSEGYKMALPFPIRPTEDDIRAGLKPSKVSKAKRDRTFPLPQPKKLDEVHTRTFNLTPKPPRDQTLFLVAGVLLFVVVLSMLAASC